MNLIWNKNKTAFCNRFPSLAKTYDTFIMQDLSASADIFSFWSLQETKDGNLTATENGLRLHSAYNPVREAASAMAQEPVATKGTSIFLGCGLGYHVIEWAKLYPNKKLIIIEPDPLHFFAALTIMDWTEVFKIPDLIIALACPPDTLMPLLENPDKINMGNEGVSDAFILNLPAFTSHNQDYYNVVLALIERNKRKNEINAATLKKFGKLWSRNCKKNKDQLQNHCGIKDLKDSFTDRPFLLVAAGPSLEQALPYMKQLKQKAVIICVETALPALLKAGVQPDFIIITDPQYWAYKHIAGLQAPESVLITEICAYPSVFRFKCKKIMLCGSQIPDGQAAEKAAGLELGDLGSGGSVASAAWNFAVHCGAKNIYLCGLDLGFPGKQTHIKGSSAEQTWHTVSTKLSSAENFVVSTISSANAETSVNYKGTPILTDSRMKMFAWWFESRIASCPDVKTFALSGESLKIPGVEVCNIEDFLKN